MATRTSRAEWQADLRSGHGQIDLGSGAFRGTYSFGSRFEQAPGTNPEELLGAALAGCFAMALSHLLAGKGYRPRRVTAAASVSIDKVGEGFAIGPIQLDVDAEVPGVSEDVFRECAEDAKVNCPVSKALAATSITMTTRVA